MRWLCIVILPAALFAVPLYMKLGLLLPFVVVVELVYVFLFILCLAGKLEW